MILESLEIENFRVYYGPEKIEFANGDKNITIIQGNNEVGKTTIMNAITWCLYGKEFYKGEGKKPIWNLYAEDNLEIGDEDTVKVILSMRDAENNSVQFIRTLDFYKNDKGNCVGGTKNFKILVDDGQDTNMIGIPETYLNKTLPRKLRKYFLFDGEQLENYFNLDNSENIQKSVDNLSQLNLLKRVTKHIGILEDKYLKEYSNLNPSLGNIKKQIKTLEKDIADGKSDLENIKINLKNYDISIKDYETQLKNYGEDPEDLIKEREEKEEELNDLIGDIKDKNAEYDKYLTDNFHYIFGYSALNDVQEKGKYLRKNNFIPSDYKKHFLEEMLENHVCICGNELEEGSEAYKKIQIECDGTDEITNIEEEVNDLLGSVKTDINNYPIDFKETLKKKIQEIGGMEKNRSKISKRMKEIDNELDASDRDEVKSIQSDLDSVRKSKDSDLIKQGSIETNIGILEKKLKKIKTQEIEEQKKVKALSEVEKNLNFCQAVKKESQKLENQIAKSIHSKLEKLTTEQFKSIHWKNMYERVDIDSKYNVTIFQKDGTEIVAQDLSKGGELTLALSFMLALNSLSGFELPILIDTPMGRLDKEIKMNISEFLPKYTKNKQVTLLVTKTEYDDEFRESIHEFVGKEYKLRFSTDNGGITQVVQW